MRIYKYNLNLVSNQMVSIPSKSEIMDIQMQNGIPVMWALVDIDSKNIDIKIKMYGTGQSLGDSLEDHEYLATVQDSPFVWHFFMAYEK